MSPSTRLHHMLNRFCVIIYTRFGMQGLGPRVEGLKLGLAGSDKEALPTLVNGMFEQIWP
eukprot:4233790-Karenia_brevis.AAC.1